MLILHSNPTLCLTNAAKYAPISTHKFICIKVQSVIAVDFEHFHLTHVHRSDHKQ